jgi:hypothetical protein
VGALQLAACEQPACDNKLLPSQPLCSPQMIVVLGRGGRYLYVWLRGCTTVGQGSILASPAHPPHCDAPWEQGCLCVCLLCTQVQICSEVQICGCMCLHVGSCRPTLFESRMPAHPSSRRSLYASPCSPPGLCCCVTHPHVECASSCCGVCSALHALCVWCVCGCWCVGVSTHVVLVCGVWDVSGCMGCMFRPTRAHHSLQLPAVVGAVGHGLVLSIVMQVAGVCGWCVVAVPRCTVAVCASMSCMRMCPLCVGRHSVQLLEPGAARVLLLHSCACVCWAGMQGVPARLPLRNDPSQWLAGYMCTMLGMPVWGWHVVI